MGEKEARVANPLYADLRGNSSPRNFPHLGASPPNPQKRRRRRVVSLDFTEADYEVLRREAQRLGFKLRTYCRRAILKELGRTEKLPSAQELRASYRALARELRRWGVNLNQVAKHCNQHRKVDREVLRKLEKIDKALEHIIEVVRP